MGTNVPILKRVHVSVKRHVSPNRNEQIRGRLNERLRELGREGDYAWIAAQVGENRGQVWKWVTGDTETFPAAFAAALEEAGVVSARWLLTSVGAPEVREPGTEAVRLSIIGRLANGSLDDAAVRRIAEAATPLSEAPASETLEVEQGPEQQDETPEELPGTGSERAS